MEKILYLVLGIMLIYLIKCIIFDKHNTIVKEGFDTEKDKNIKIYNNNNLFDKFYSNVYDLLFDNYIKNDYEMEKIIHYTKMDSNSFVLDVGCGTGYHINYLKKKQIPAIGVDKSIYMINKSKQLYPENDYKQGDILKLLDIDLIHKNSKFTHILLLYFTIYYIDNIPLLFDNCFNLLESGGYIILHLVDRNRFDPILNAANPLILVDPQKYAKKRITNSIIKFKNFDYSSNFELDNNQCKFIETFSNNNGGKRINKHTLHMLRQKEIISIARNAGFILKTQISLSDINYNNQFIYILYKP